MKLKGHDRKIDVTKIGQCHLEEFFLEEIILLKAVAALLSDLARLSDIPGEFPKVVQLDIDSLCGLQGAIERAAWSLDEKIQALHDHMGAMRTVAYTYGRPRSESEQETEPVSKAAEVQPARAPSNGKGRQAASPRKASMRGKAA